MHRRSAVPAPTGKSQGHTGADRAGAGRVFGFEQRGTDRAAYFPHRLGRERHAVRKCLLLHVPIHQGAKPIAPRRGFDDRVRVDPQERQAGPAGERGGHGAPAPGFT